MDKEIEKKLIVHDYGKHQYNVNFEKTDYFCMNCGQKDVWDDNSADYYVGSSWVCFKCGSTWYNPSDVKDCDWFDQIKAQLEKEE